MVHMPKALNPTEAVIAGMAAVEPFKKGAGKELCRNNTHSLWKTHLFMYPPYFKIFRHII